jgi:hypothetical protein
VKTFVHSLAVLLVLPISNALAQSWVFHKVDVSGTRPDIDVDSEDNAHIAYWKTTAPGNFYINHAKWNPATESFEIRSNFDGNPEAFVSLALDMFDLPHMTFHDHGGWEVMHVYDSSGVLVSELFGLPVHDGWASCVRVDSQNRLHASFLPECCGVGTDGVAYAMYDGTSWTSEYIGSGPDIWIYNGTSLAIDSQDNPHVTYYFDAGLDLKHAVKVGSVWTHETVDATGDVGRHSSVTIDGSDFPRISYYQYLTATNGIIKHAAYNGSSWAITNIDTLEHVAIGPQSQGMISMDIDAIGRSHIVYADQEVVTYAILDGSTLTREVIVDYTSVDTALGGRASLKLDSFGRPHITYGVVQQSSNWCMYVTKEGLAPVVSDIPDQTIPLGQRFTGIRLDNYVTDGDNSDSEITWTWSGNVLLTVGYDPTRRRARVRAPNGWTGSETITFTATDPTGFSDSDAATFTVTAASGEVAATDQENESSPALRGNYPNPFNPSTTIGYHVNEPGWVKLAVYDLLGREVALLVDQFEQAGLKSVVWNGTSNTGEALSSGIYIYRLNAGGALQTGRMMLMK